jgi:hypothetical protein
LAEHFLQGCRDIASQFDARNGNDRYARLVAENERLIAFKPA